MSEGDDKKRLNPKEEVEVLIQDLKDLERQAFESRMKKLGEAFRALADDRERLDAVYGMVTVLKARLKNQDGMFLDWLTTAEGNLKGCLMIYQEPKKQKK